MAKNTMVFQGGTLYPGMVQCTLYHGNKYRPKIPWYFSWYFQFHPIRTLGSSPHSLVAWNLGQGGATGQTFAPGATHPRATTDPCSYTAKKDGTMVYYGIPWYST